MATEGCETPESAKHQPKTAILSQNAQSRESLLSPRFRSVAAMAGWDEETLLLASLVVEDTPERESKHKKRPRVQNTETPVASSRVRRRARRQSPAPSPVAVINIEDDKDTDEKAIEAVKLGDSKDEKDEQGSNREKQCSASATISSLPCIDRLREELSCAICLEICFEPSTTPCGHSFCKKCLKSAAEKCGKRCPKCRQLIGNGRSCTVNTVLWNTIQLLFPQEIEARKAAAAATGNARESKKESPSVGSSGAGHRLGAGRRVRRTPISSQEEDAALASRLQREEFLVAFQGTQDLEEPRGFRWANEWIQTGNSYQSARARLRAMASMAAHLRRRR